ncbi:MAG: hypothetical protein GF317_11535 [Candidatus Lokiarchaeota archaeon]|nr:hypothetical protein [Candidatus Lokiarchaeota archaeon]MBD3200283.1 hypothetical protein [Candidatus Lokiarchaeota archaeon]
MDEIKNILFICTGNTARSPAAEYLAKYYMNEYGLNLHIESAGFINAFSYMQPLSKRYLDKYNIDYIGFSPQIVNRELVQKNDLIITMETSHKHQLFNEFGNIKVLKNKTFTLKEFTGDLENHDIIDPYYTSDEEYRKILGIIDKHVERLIKILKE